MGDVTVRPVIRGSGSYAYFVSNVGDLGDGSIVTGISTDRLRAILAEHARYRAALERIADAKPYRLTHREIASIARMALTDAARIEEGNDG